MAHRHEEQDWVEQVPMRRRHGLYRDWGWERRLSGLPQFRDPSVHRMPYERRAGLPPRAYDEDLREDQERKKREI